MILISYDGSADAKEAIGRVGEMMRDEPATVLTVWQPLALILARSTTAMGAWTAGTNTENADAASRKAAEQTAAEGVELARQVGLDAVPRTSSQETTIADAILDEAAAVGASAVVMGSRGLTGLKSLLLGSVSHAVIQHADRAVIVVPSPEVAASRSRARRHIHGSK
jgi:nucleotide-binding universal stress UspA family protein